MADFAQYEEDPDGVTYNWIVVPEDIGHIGQIIVEEEYRENLGQAVPSLGNFPMIDVTGDS